MKAIKKASERSRRWRAKHKDQYKATLEGYKEKNKSYEEIADEPERNYKTFEELYCDNYQKDELSCIQCYSNQTAQYKACHKKGGKYGR